MQLHSRAGERQEVSVSPASFDDTVAYARRPPTPATESRDGSCRANAARTSNFLLALLVSAALGQRTAARQRAAAASVPRAPDGAAVSSVPPASTCLAVSIYRE